MPLEMLEVVDENDNVIGLETRTKVHEQGLLHREIHIFLLPLTVKLFFSIEQKIRIHIQTN